MEVRKRCCHSSSTMEDRLSNLPEPILHHILSFLDMKYVTPTCVLSRRWRTFWYSLPALSFDKQVFQSRCFQKFSSFVNLAMLWRWRDSSSIDSITLFLNDECWKFDCIDQLIIIAVLRNVKEINFQIDFTEEKFEFFKFPDCLFTCKTLTILKLCFLDRYCDATELRLPDMISLPSLQTLHMRLVKFSMYNDFFDILFGGCPVLETLVMIQCQFTSSKVLTLSSIQLKHLHIDMNYGCNELLETFVIRVPSLLRYCWRSPGWSAFSLEGLSLLETANIDPGQCYDTDDCKDSRDLEPIGVESDKGMMDCLKALYNVKRLTLSSNCLQLISEFPSELEKWPTQFSNLRHLNLQTWLTRGCFEVTMFLLKNSPDIETLVLRMDPIFSLKTIEHGLGSSSNLKLLHLRAVELRKVSGCKHELQHLRILIGTSEALKEVTIIKSDNAENWKVFTAEVLTLPRASPDVRINFRDA